MVVLRVRWHVHGEVVWMMVMVVFMMVWVMVMVVFMLERMVVLVVGMVVVGSKDEGTLKYDFRGFHLCHNSIYIFEKKKRPVL